jgi:hypothetical protein
MATLRQFLTAAVVVVAVAMPSYAATPAEFYLGMLQKGISAYDAGKFEAATGPLRISAFGFVDSVEHYQMSHVYLALSYDRLGDAVQATQSARRVATAERIEPRYTVLSLPAATRSAFEALARKLLSPADLASLQRTAEAPAPQRPQTQTVPSRTTAPPLSTKPATTQQTTTVRPTPDPAKPEPAKPQVVKPEPTPVQNAPAQTTAPRQQPQTTSKPPEARPAQPKPAQPKPAESNPPKTAPATMSPAPTTAAPARPAPARTAPATTPSTTVGSRFAAAEQALAAARLNDARALYRELLDVPSLDRTQLLRLAEGLYRARDFGPTLRAFNRLGTLRRGEEPYRYYIAVACYETGQYARAKQELTAVLPYIEITPDVARYKSKIEGAVN